MPYEFLTPILGPFLKMNPLLAIGILSFIFSLAVTLVYKYTTNQSLMKQLKDEIKELQKEVKELKNDPQAMMRVQKEMMQTNFKYMGMSFRATLITIIPFIFIFGWMNAHFAYEPINPGDSFMVSMNFKKDIADGSMVALTAPDAISIEGSPEKEISGKKVLWTLKGQEGSHMIEFDYKGQKYSREVVITTGKGYAEKIIPVKQKGSDVKSIELAYNKKVVLDVGFFKFGWLMSYFLFSIVFSLGLRKLLKVY